MPRTKTEVPAIRTTAEVKALLRLAAERERRSAASMVEVLVLEQQMAGNASRVSSRSNPVVVMAVEEHRRLKPSVEPEPPITRCPAP